MERRWSEDRYQPAAESVRRPSSATTPTSVTVHAAAAATVPTLASASLPASVQKFMPPHIRDPFLDHPGYAHALISPEYDATIIHRSPEEEARDQVLQTNNRRSNTKFHVRMAMFIGFLLAGPFILGVILQMQHMNTDTAALVVILGWVIAIAVIPVWIVMGASRRNAARAGASGGLAPGAYPKPYSSKY